MHDEVERKMADRPGSGPCYTSGNQETTQTVSQPLDLQQAGNVKQLDVQQGNNRLKKWETRLM